jgi:hypothetical protein
MRIVTGPEACTNLEMVRFTHDGMRITWIDKWHPGRFEFVNDDVDNVYAARGTDIETIRRARRIFGD